jgi:hypothetical protein
MANSIVNIRAFVVTGLVSSAAFAQSTSSRTIHQTVHVGVQTPVYVQTITNAACKLRTIGANDPTEGLSLYADERDIVLFYTNVGVAGTAVDLSLECSGNDGVGPTANYQVSLRAVPESQIITSDTAWLADVPHRGRQLPALTGDPTQISQEKLLALGYPARPDPAKSPQQYSDWVKFVSQPWTAIPSRHLASRQRTGRNASNMVAVGTITPNVINTSGYDFGWSGFAMETSVTCSGTFMNNPTYNFVTGQFYAPSISDPPSSSFHQYAVSEWVGLGGNFKNSAVAQAGLDIWDSCVNNVCNSTYTLWNEFTPDSLTTVYQGIQPSDAIALSVQMVNSNGQPSALGPYAHFGMAVPNRGWCIGGCLGQTITNSTQSGFTGDGAEWIIERIGLNGCGGYTDLSNYQNSTIFSAFAKVDGCPYELNYLQSGNYTSQIPMISCTQYQNHELSTVASGKRDYHGADMQFSWHYPTD